MRNQKRNRMVMITPSQSQTKRQKPTLMVLLSSRSLNKKIRNLGVLILLRPLMNKL